MTGYHGQPEATADRLRDGWLGTGDLGRLLDDGQLCLVGRRTDLIVSGGENIYPAEVEAALRAALPDLREVCVVGRPSDRWGQEVGVLLVLPPGRSLTVADLRAALAGSLASFKQPRSIRLVDALPLTATGKPDRLAAVALLAADPPQT
jgi:acyl-CoA synthetase (AMP-forming)/AMP-acid ligase II